MSIGRSALLWASDNETLRTRLPQLPFVRRAVRRFMPGESVEDALAAAADFGELNIGTILTELGENLTELSEAEAVTRHYLDVIDRIEAEGLNSEISIKLTSLGLDLDREQAYENLSHLAERALRAGNWVWVDMEASEYVDVTLDLYRRARGRFSNVGVCLQAYLYRTADDLEGLLGLEPAIRLVKGAYREPHDIAFPKKADVDANFFALSKRMLQRAAEGELRAGIATHDAKLIERIQEYSRRETMPADTYEIQMLYGICASDQRRLASSGQPTRVLISYGAAWYPWYMRRLAERPANVVFVAKSLYQK